MTDVSMLELDLKVVGCDLVTQEVRQVRLRHPDGRPLPAWQPGAHIDLLLPDGMERQYSLCGDPDLIEEWSLAVLREPTSRGGSQYVHEKLSAGDMLRVRGPNNHFELHPAGSYRFVAGGVGITPLLPMILDAERAGADWTLDYLGRSRRTMAYLESLQQKYGQRVRAYPAAEGPRFDLGSFLESTGGSSGAPLYVCGPARLLDAVSESTGGWPAGTVHMERFEARDVGAPVFTETFEVEFALSGVTAEVPPERTILDVAEQKGIFVLSSCREGTCGTCETPIIDGQAEHRDSILSQAEQSEDRAMMICCSRAACPRLVLEL